jgi:DNA-binding transcriptional MerR regulator
MKQKFGAGELCRLTGISAETLRHYVECGVVDSVEIAANNYKKYDARNAIDVLHARMCRGLDLGLPQIVHKAEFALEEQEALLLRHESVLQAEALELDLKLGRLRQQIEFLSSARGSLGRVIERSAEEVPSLYRLLLIGEGLGSDSDARRLTDQWMAHPQYTHVAIGAPRAALLDPEIEVLPMEIGIGVRAEFAALLKLDTRPPAVFFPSARNVGTVIAVSDPLRIRKAELRGLFDRVESLGCDIASDLVGRLCTSLETDRGRLYVFTVSFCIK